MTAPGEAGRAVVVLVTAPAGEAALTLGRALVDERLAACVNVLPGLTSIYTWQGNREETHETLLVIKTEARRYADLERRVLELHPYSVPEVLAVSVQAGARAYLDWVRESVTVEGR